MKVFQIQVGPMQNFVYLLMDEKSKEAMAVDSGWEVSPIMSVASGEGMLVKYVCATHGHFDHVKTLDQLATGLRAASVSHENSGARTAMKVRDGDVLQLGERSVRVIHTPGHTEDSVCYYDGVNLFTGDTLFVDAWGRTDLPGGSPEKMFSSIHDIIMKLPPETVIYSGHDYGTVPFRTLGEEIRENPALRARTVGEFVRLTQD